MSRSIFGVTVSPLLAWCVLHPDRFAAPLDVMPRAWSPFSVRVHGRDLRKGDLLALTVSASGRTWDDTHAGALVLREKMDTTVPTHREGYAALRGRVVAVATLRGATTRQKRADGARDPWREEGLRAALGCFDRADARAWWWELGDVIALARPVECAGDVGLWSLPHHVAVETMAQVRAVEAARAAGAAR